MLKVVSLFSGAGGLDLGFIGGFNFLGKHYASLPFDIIFANDNYPQAVDTYRYNIGHHIIEGDIVHLLKNRPDILPATADVVIGGFPCQDFSVAGKRQGITVKRGRLYLQMHKVIQKIAPKVFVAENVEGLLNLEKGLILEVIMNDLAKITHEGKTIHYNVSHHLLNAADYGVPQTRRRLFIVGIRQDLESSFTPPKAVVSEENWVTSKEAIDDLWGKEKCSGIPNHKQISRARFYPGKTMQGNVQIRPDRPSITIRAEHHGNIEAHYRTLNNSTDNSDMSGWRRLTVRECARIQSFPDSFIFKGAMSHTYRLVGNAVPPVLGWHVARSIKEVLLQD